MVIFYDPPHLCRQNSAQLSKNVIKRLRTSKAVLVAICSCLLYIREFHRILGKISADASSTQISRDKFCLFE